ncbi:hypothetical protein [Salinicola sp. DM10]|uniref:hypothetical protein n=1 Tax=Salinicola sp. DM10 TaxID=2815721 RepID=UPI001A8F563C|nr:hypothetical protein [Salinicola sp. DM10]MCE3025764.1 hypothetical protein [Salinicola sp. DM10]
MSTVEIDLARHERAESRRAADEERFWSEHNNALALLDAGQDYDSRCDQETVEELLGAEDERFWQLVRTLRTAASPTERDAAARQLQQHCNRVVDDMVTRYLERRAKAA